MTILYNFQISFKNTLRPEIKQIQIKLQWKIHMLIHFSKVLFVRNGLKSKTSIFFSGFLSPLVSSVNSFSQKCRVYISPKLKH